MVSSWLLVVGCSVGGIFLGSATAWLFLRKQAQSLANSLTTTQLELARVQERSLRVEKLEGELSKQTLRVELELSKNSGLSGELGAKDEEQQRNLQVITDLRQQAAVLQARNEALIAEVAALQESTQKEAQHSAEKAQFLEEAREQLSNTFKALANDVLEEKTGKLSSLNEGQLGVLLNPLQDKLREFNESVQRIHYQQGQERASLTTELAQLKQLNQTLSQDAQSLTFALKGSSKIQGNWGEMILERILEASGLEKGREYELRETYHFEDGRRGQPDVIIKLPEAKHIIIDAKVSLSDYDDYCNAANDSDAASAAERHVDSVRRHMKELSEKSYQELYGLNSLDFVVMFVPIEPAFAAAISADPKLWDNALRKNVLLVSPSGLLFVLRTVGVLWRQEYQARNVQEIARKGGDLYNKLCGFVEELDEVGFRLQQARTSFDEARKKLCTGQGNVIRQAEMLKQLGVKPNKSLPSELVDLATQSSAVIPPLVALAQEHTPPDDTPVQAPNLGEDEIPF